MPAARHLFMMRPHLRGIPTPAPPPDVTLRTFRYGDESDWLEVIQSGYGGLWSADAFERCVRSDEAFRPERVLMAVGGGRILGVVGAFQKIIHGDRTGYIHMMAVRREHQRRGIGAALLRRGLEYFRDQAWLNAVLDTDASRLPAVRLYLDHGFLPFPETVEEMETWRSALTELDRREMAQGLRLCGLPEGTDDAPER